MPVILLMIMLMSSEQSQGALGNCPAHTMTNKKNSQMIEFLQTMQGRYQLGSCYVEIQACSTNDLDTETRDSLIADMLIVDSEGFERYIPFYVPEFKDSKTRQIEIQNSRMLHYRHQDNNYDQATGKDERWAVEFVKTPDLQRLEYIEIGYSSQTQRTKKIAKKWIICGTDRENEVNGHPVRHKVNSWLHSILN